MGHVRTLLASFVPLFYHILSHYFRHAVLVLSPKKTRVTHTLTPYEGNVGFDFLGYTVRQFPVGKTHTGKDTKGKPLGYKTINKPSKQAIKTHIQKTNQLMKKLKSAPQRRSLANSIQSSED